MSPTGRTRTRTAVIAAASAIALALAGCGSDEPSAGSDSESGQRAGDDGATEPDSLAQLSEIMKSAAAGHDIDIDELLSGAGSPGPADGPDAGGADDGGSSNGDGQADGGAGEWHPLTWHVPQEGTTPDGFHRYPAHCEDPALDATERHEWITYAVPADWKLYGKTSGSGSPFNDSSKATYQRGDGNSHDDFAVEFSPDSTEPDKSAESGWSLVDHNGDPWESFDYVYQIGDTEYQITHEAVATATIGAQTVDVWFADQQQAPEALSKSTYLARVMLAEMPTMPAMMPGETPPWRDISTVISIDFDATNDRIEPLTPQTAADIISSLALPDCGVRYVVAVNEFRLNTDLDGDGHIATQQEMMDAMRGEG